MNSSSREKGIAKPRKTVSFLAFGFLPLTKSFRKVRWKVNGTRSIGISEKVVMFPRRNVPNGNSSSISSKPSLIPVSGFDGTQISTNAKRDSGTKVTAYQSRILLTIYANRNRPVCRPFSSFSLNK